MMGILERRKTYDFRSFLNGQHVTTTAMTVPSYTIDELEALEEPLVMSEEIALKKQAIKKKFPYSLFPLTFAPLFSSVKAHAQTATEVAAADIQSKMMSAFDPLISLIQGLAYPVAMVVVLGGAIFVMIGNSDRGFGMMQKAGLGYLLVMIAPMVLDVLVDSMKGVV